MECPTCGYSLNIDDDITSDHCAYCGTRIKKKEASLPKSPVIIPVAEEWIPIADPESHGRLNQRHQHELGKSCWECYKTALFQNYANFQGRASRKEYWSLALISLIMTLPLAIVSALISPDNGYVFIIIYLLVLIIPFWSATVRRLHDIGKSGWWVCIQFLPYIGGLILIILTVQKSQANANMYGD